MRFKGEKWELFGDVISARRRRLSAFRILIGPFAACKTPAASPAGVFFCGETDG